MKVLIVDDEATARYGMRKIWVGSFEVFEASSLTGARRLSKDHRPDIVLLDVNLGGDDGFDLLEETQRSKSPALAVIVTAHGSERVTVEAMKKGASDYLAKLSEHNQHITHTAEAIGMYRQSLRQKIKDLGLRKNCRIEGLSGCHDLERKNRLECPFPRVRNISFRVGPFPKSRIRLFEGTSVSN